ncbi:LANO_0D03026g1_1 [Lachancea nothofagi CBS 11611]|uniref:LANO_0D03026g1_1 n=1 Tax=Lachancea nothofagi CBS 11611 TaxID=1266666 RepID=A0A1G4JFK1_9SACH|nr:LANO_0D03026g1_1 [Lachancea nothofagi CBS 11611]
MGKGVAKYGFQSGILPTARSILKNPTVKQTDVLEKLKAPKPKGAEGVGYAGNIAHPRGSHRLPPKVEFVDVEELVTNTVPEPQHTRAPKTTQQAIKLHKAQVRRSYLSESFRKEEERVLRQAQLLKEKEAQLHQERQQELAALNETRSSDLTIPTMENLLRGPLMRQRTPEEKEILQMKRKQNRDIIQLKSKERKLENLLKLHHVTDEFIVSESQLTKKIDEVFANESSEALRTKLSVGTARPRSRNEKEIGDALFGSLGGGSFVGLPTIKEYVSGEMSSFAKEVEAKSEALKDQKSQDMETIL